MVIGIKEKDRKKEELLVSFFKRNTDEIILSWLGQREEDSFSIFNLHAPTHLEKLLREESSSFNQYITKEP